MIINMMKYSHYTVVNHFLGYTQRFKNFG